MKTKYDIITEIANKKIVEQIVFQINRKEQKEDLHDLIQYIYLQLLEKPDELIEGLYARNEINFYLVNMVYNQIRSQTSYFHKVYRLPRQKSIELIENIL